MEWMTEQAMPIDDNSKPPLPVVRGDWIESRNDSQPQIGKVVNSQWVERDGKLACMVDVALYAYSGDRIGRQSPAMGGPRTYEPWVAYADWFRIEKPYFPVKLDWVENKGVGGATLGWVTNARRIEDRTEHPRKRKSAGYRPRAVPKPANTDFDPELEVRTRRMAAQELRDVHRETPSPALLSKVERLEAEASAIAREHGLEK